MPSADPVDDTLLTKLGNLLRDGSIQPPPTGFEIRALRLDAGECAAVIVPPQAAPPVRLDGDCWVRHGPQVVRATPEEERRLAERGRAGNLPFEACPAPGATLDDLDLDLFHIYLERVVSAETLAQNSRPTGHQLLAQRFAALDGCPTWGGILLIGRSPRSFIPTAYLQMVRYGGDSLSDDILDQAELATPIIRAWGERLRAHLPGGDALRRHRRAAPPGVERVGRLLASPNPRGLPK